MVTFSYKLIGAGWSRATIADGPRVLEMRVSYLSDALRDLTAVVIALMRGADHAACVWHDEPGSYSWILDREDGDLQIIIAQGHQMDRYLGENDTLKRCPEDPIILFSARCPIRRFAGQVLTQLWHILSERGMDGYKEVWERHDFPIVEYQALEELMKHGAGR